MDDVNFEFDPDRSAILQIVAQCENEETWASMIEVMADILPEENPDSTIFIRNVLECIALPSKDIVARLNVNLIKIAQSM
jgi:hypothetical protein